MNPENGKLDTTKEIANEFWEDDRIIWSVYSMLSFKMPVSSSGNTLSYPIILPENIILSPTN